MVAAAAHPILRNVKQATPRTNLTSPTCSPTWWPKRCHPLSFRQRENGRPEDSTDAQNIGDDSTDTLVSLSGIGKWRAG